MTRLLARALLGAAFACTALAAHAVGVTLPAYDDITLDNGVTLLLMRKADVPLVAARIAVRGGALADAAGKEGTASQLAELLGKGAGKRDARAFAEAIDGAGGELRFGASREALVADASFLADDTGLMLDLLADAFLHPTLSLAEFEKSRTRAVQSIAAAKDGDPRGLIGSYAQAWLFRDHPYGRPEGGDEASLAALTLADLRAYYTAYVGADRAVIAIVGDFDPASMRKAVEQRFGAWGKATGRLPAVPPKLRETGRRVLLVDKPGATQTYFWVGNVGAAVDDPARAAQDLVQTVFGGRFTSMLNTELRVKSGLTYGARASIERLARPGAAGFSSFTRTDATAQALDLAFDTVDRLHAEGIADDMQASAKRYVLGQFAPDYETADQLAGALASLHIDGLGRDAIDGYGERIERATAADIAAARSVFPTRDDSLLVVIGDASKIGDAIGKYGPVTKIALSDPGFGPGPTGAVTP
ncbi:M16 family metallopeptidase [Chiayiivirga flava]|uniref:Putative Zn-dependent peptidase n=1 Tax=Chiayiivirga flava TaxID=659595 RepID=A0A7W8DAE2_9GAMM|nr:pitrilysin family protein [Chiayiivirga flava]MBB5209506.1 putative Zn-dependent peptidase [Chiayiivirga flava]